MLPRKRGGLDALSGFAPTGASEDPTGAADPNADPLGAEQLPVDVSTGQLGNDQLAGFADPQGAAAQDPEYAAMEAAYNDPNTPPDVRALLEQQLAMAARQMLAGL